MTLNALLFQFPGIAGRQAEHAFDPYVRNPPKFTPSRFSPWGRAGRGGILGEPEGFVSSQEELACAGCGRARRLTWLLASHAREADDRETGRFTKSNYKPRSG
uniref:Uncharacterized protein n=1 Tax=Sphaerodactylus townsendi TaxID=933632 RepID=A0ACB8FK95_9SAUR